MKAIYMFIVITFITGCDSSTKQDVSSFYIVPVVKNFDGNYTGTNVVGVIYNMTLSNVNGVVSGQMTAEELHETWIVSGVANGNRLAGRITKGDLWNFELEAEAVPGDVIRFNPMNDLGMADINFKRVE